MRCLIVYSSLTGNTKKVAEAIHAVFPEGSELHPVEQAPSPSGYDFIAMGFWADRGEPDKKSQDYMANICGKRVAVFGTLGAWPDSEHARSLMAGAEAVLCERNTVLGSFVCQGKVDPKLLKAMEAMPGMAQLHPMTEERRARIEEAKKHPDEKDCANAAAVFLDILKKVEACTV